MKLYIAGGCGEHGRNCFYVESKEVCFLVDCGISADGSGDCYPHLSKEQISAINYVFLTHSHADHIGALPWLWESGYRGAVIATGETIKQCQFSMHLTFELDTVCKGGTGHFRNLSVEWGRSGHCPGSVWYHFTLNEKSILFSGDYSEHTRLYACDQIREKSAELAVLDCAYGKDTGTYEDNCRTLVEQTKQLLQEYKLVMFPVPRFGRGLELFDLLQDALPKTNFFCDDTFLQNLSGMQSKLFWYKSLIKDKTRLSRFENNPCGIVFVSDPQLRTEAAREVADFVRSSGGIAVMTGTVEHGSFSEALLKANEMKLLRYPVHLNYTQFTALKQNNHFAHAIPYHTSEIPVESPVLF